MIMRVPKVIVQPVGEHILLPEARLHLRLDAYDSPSMHPDDSLITALITAAREWAENFTGRSIATKTLEMALDQFPAIGYYGGCVRRPYMIEPAYWYDLIEIPRGPVQSIVSVTFTDTTESPQDQVAQHRLDTHSEPAWLIPLADATWPAVTAGPGAVKIRYVAGYTLPGDSPDTHPLPKAIKQAMLLLLGHWYESREDASSQKLESIPLGAEALLRQYRLEKGMA